MAKDVEITIPLDELLTPDNPKVKVAISLPELVNQTNAFSTKNRPGCVAKLVGSSPKELFLKYNVKCDLKTSDPQGHEVKIRFDVSQVNRKTLAKSLDVKCACSCKAFLYWGGQWNSHQRDALEGEPRPLLIAPTERLDLRGKFIICKHLRVVADRVLPSVQRNIYTILRKREDELYMKRLKKKNITEEPNIFPVRRKKVDTPPTPKNPPTTEKAPEQENSHKVKQKQQEQKNEQIKQDLKQKVQLKPDGKPKTPPHVVRTAPAVVPEISKGVRQYPSGKPKDKK